MEGIDRELVYQVFEEETKDVSTLGPYELENHSLYVNDYVELPTAIVPVEETNPVIYNLSFIVKNLTFEEVISNPSEKENMISAELTDLFMNSSINATFMKCIVHTFREVTDDSTRVTANCSFKNESVMEGIDRELVYQVFEEETKDFSTLGPYELENHSLYVNDYMELPTAIVPVEETNPIKYNLSFIVKNPTFGEIKSNPSKQANMIAAELTDLFMNSRIKATFMKCIVHTFREVTDDSTQVTANCLFKYESAVAGIDRELVYQVFEEETKGISTLGPYELENHSLYVNDYMELPTAIVPVEETNPIKYNLSFVVKNPTFGEFKSNPSKQANMIAAELTDLFMNSRIKATFMKCIVHTFREVTDDSTQVTANCLFKYESAVAGIDRELVYQVFEEETKGISTLGPYELENHSLYVNDYSKVPTVIVPVEETNPIKYNLSFIVKNPTFGEIKSNPSKQANMIAAELTDLFLNSRINATFMKCIIHTFREVTDDSTRVTANCSFKNESAMEGIDRELVYQVFEEETKDFSTLGPYELEKYSLYVNDYRKIPTIIVPVEETNPIKYNLSFIVKNPTFGEIKSNPSKQANMIVAELMDLFMNSRIHATFMKCIIYIFREVTDDSTRVTANCSFKNESAVKGIDRELVYQVFEEETKDISTLGPYELENHSLYVNDYRKIPTFIVPVTETYPFHYNVTFVVNNLRFEDIQSNPSEKTSLIAAELTDLFKNSNINTMFLKCAVESFSGVTVDSTRVTANCSFKKESAMEGIDRELVYQLFEEETKDISTLGPYKLENHSLYVNGYTEISTVIVPLEEPNAITYNVIFTVKNRTSEVLSNSSEKASMIAAELTDLFKNSKINATFLKCAVESFSEVTVDSTRVTANCSFKNESAMEGIDRELVYQVFEEQTKDISTLGPYELENHSLYVNDYGEIPTVIVPLDEANAISYNVTFIVNNLTSEDVASNSSEKAGMIAAELTDLFKNSNINATFLKCAVESFSGVTVDSTRVTANCLFKNESAMEGIDRELVYQVLEEETKDISTLGPYDLENHSLYINDYREIPTVIVPLEEPNTISFNVTFTANNLPSQEFASNSSEKASMIAAELTDLFKNSKINATFLKCAVQSFREVMDVRPRVTANCSFKNESAMEGIDRELVYQVFEEETKDISTLGPYELEKYSLYVNDYRKIPTFIVPVEEQHPIHYNLTFVVNDLRFEDVQSYPSGKASLIAAELTDLFKNSNINATFLKCAVELFSGVTVDSTRVTTNCLFKNESAVAGIDRELVYQVFEEETKGISTLGPYELEKYSLYVNGYREIPTIIVPVKERKPNHYNVTFTVNNLKFEDIQSNPSEKASMIAAELKDLFKNSKINATFLTCVIESFSGVTVDSTRVTANCSFKNESAMEGIDRELLYQVFEEETKDISTLGPYDLENHSLYVNDYREIPTVIVPLEEANAISYNVTFTVNNLTSQEIASNSPEKASMIAAELTDLFKNSKINATFLKCAVDSFGGVTVDSTRVTANCSFKNESAMAGIDRELVYQVLEEETKDISTLGPYELENHSLYVNDYGEIPTVIVPLDEANAITYNVTFIVNNLTSEDVASISPEKAGMIAAELTDLFKNSKINATFLKCAVQSFREVMDVRPRVTANCSFKNESAMEGIDRELVYQVFEEETKDISTLGPYELEKYSLYVNDYRKIPTFIVPVEEQHPIHYNLTFVVNDLRFEDVQSYPSGKASLIAAELTDLFKNSNINATFLKCAVELFSGVTVDSTRVTTNCLFKNESAVAGIDRELVYQVFEEETKGISTLGPYELEKYSLYVNGYREIPTIIVPVKERKPNHYNVTFTVNNLKFEDIQSNPSEKASMIAAELKDLFKNSKINATFLTCVIESFSGVTVDSTRVTANCSFKNESAMEGIDRELLYQVFEEETKDISTLGPYDLENHSLYVNDYREIPTVIVPLEEANAISYNVTFTVNNLTSQEIASNSPEKASMIAAELTDLFKNSKINATFLKCAVDSFGGVTVDSTRVTANCSFKNESAMAGIDRELVYQVLEEETKDISTLGPYELENHSLYVNDYGEIPTVIVPLDEANAITYNVTFIVNNLTSEDVASISPEKAGMIAAELTDLFKNSKINATFLKCAVDSFSEVTVDSTRVTANCSFKNESAMEGIDRELLYQVFEEETKDISTLGPYELENHSLYINDYGEIPTVIVPLEEPNTITYNMTFIVNNLTSQEIASNSSEEVTMIAAELTDLFKNSNINATFLKCAVESFSEVTTESTRVTANCSFKNESAMAGIDRELVYQVFEEETEDVSTLGPYELENYSLYVDGYREIPTIIVPVKERKPNHYNVTFTVNNLKFEDIQSNPSEKASMIAAELKDLFKNSKINATFLTCVIESFSGVTVDSTRVTANCSFKNESAMEGIDRELLYQVFEEETKDISTLGPYDLENHSLYVNDYREIPTVIVPLEEANAISYNVTFTVNNLTSQEIASNSPEKASMIAAELTDLFKNSKINATFLKCAVDSFGGVTVDSTRVTANCSFKNESAMAGIDRELVYQVLEEETKDISTLGPYELENHSLYVNDYGEIPTVIVPLDEANAITYNVTFIVNNLTSEDVASISPEKAGMIAAELTDLFKNSKINATFLKCAVDSFSEVTVDSTRVTANCSFKNESAMEGIDRELLYQVFEEETKDISTLGPYELENHSLYINDYGEIPTVIVPLEEPNTITYNMTFIVNNLTSQEIASNSSEEVTMIAAELTDLFKKSNINATFLKCAVQSFREVMDDRTRVTANCSFKNESAMEGIDRELVYQVFEEETKGISTLGPYELEKYSLYVNDYRKIPTFIVPVEEQHPIHYNLTFVVNDLRFEDVQSNPSGKASPIAAELTDLFKNSNINATFLKCAVESFSEVTAESTRVTANCSFKNESAMAGIDRELVYQVFEEETEDVSTLGPYELENYSLYVDGYREIPTIIVKETNPIHYNVTFVVNNLMFEDVQSNPSEKASMIGAELTDLFKNSNINATFLKCAVESFSGVTVDSTRVTANCSFKNESAMEGIDRELVYQVFEEETKDISTLGPYELENHSLYVNDYNESPTGNAPTANPTPVEFNVTFSITNLSFMEGLQDNTTLLYQSASSVITRELNALFNSEIETEFIDCKMISLSVISQKAKVYAICTFKNSATKQIDRVTVYRYFSDNTENLTALGPYLLDHKSLYVDDYNESTSPTKPIGKQTTGFNVTFTITTLTNSPALNDPSSLLYQSASESITGQLNTMFQNSDIKTKFTGCEVIFLSVARSQGTSVYAICSFNNTSAAENVDRVTVYHQFSYNTKNIREFGPYLLDENSLYVDDYHESKHSNEVPNKSQSPAGFNVTFTITNLPYLEALHNQTSLLYQSASLTITRQLTTLFNNSDINAEFIACNTVSLSATSSHKTKVYAICSFNDTSAEENVDRVIVYNQLSYKTRNITVLGPYSLDNNSLFVNDYHKSAFPNEPPIVAVTQQPNLSQKPLCFNVSFIITNLPVSSVLLDPTSQVHQSASLNVIRQLNAMFRNSNVRTVFSECTDISLSITNEGFVQVLAVCFFKNDSQEVDNVIVGQAFRDRKYNVSSTTIYGFNADSLQITGCEEPKSAATIATPLEVTLPSISERQGDLTFEVNFTIINVNFTDQLQNLTSSEYTTLRTNILTRMLELFTKSNLEESYKFCRVTELSPGSVKVSTSCFFDPVRETSRITQERIRSEFAMGTDGIRWLGQFQLRRSSLSVAAVSPVTSNRTELPYWAIIVIVLAILLALFFLMILGCLIALCIKKKFSGFYNMLQDPFGIYYSHLDGRK
ncbi:mucin-16-like isoform X14 [Pristis pectinata]|uniref:mucin-16-like isoform X14 n=1 Tax=Pristis pectinata TaxID=685728 RepID=UPI00223D62E0|nr:mucin-16-like isoform X14 [Pristis pectinata]